VPRLVKSTLALAAVLLVASCGGTTARARGTSPAVVAVAARATADALVVAPLAHANDDEHAEGQPVAWAEGLAPLRFVRVRGGDALEVRLYRRDGSLDEAAAATLDRLLDDNADGDAPRAIDRRVLQLVAKAADHFHAREVLIVSGWRDAKRPGSRHAMGQAMDFMLAGVTSGQVAQYLRTGARVGVGIYTHPRTRFVHLDVREESFHWIDASPPGRTWREKGITDRGAATRDRAYSPAQDLPG
jgi:uncharacterized protein YcbK (DUF882 family)